MYNIHPTIIDQNSNFYNESAKLACIYYDISAKLTALINRSVSELGDLGVGNCRRGNATGRAVKSHADARGSRAEGRIIQRLPQLCECGFGLSIRIRIRTEQRAGRWRAAYPLIWENNNGTYIDKEHTGTDPTKMDTDSDGLTDGQEVEGWEVGIYFQATKEAKGDPWHVTSDPNIIDTDSDGLNDYDEFQNGADPNNMDTDGDYIFDKDELIDDDDENTPTAFDGVAPSITISVKTTEKWWKRYFMEIKINTKDLAGVDWIKFDIIGDGKKEKKINLFNEKDALVEISHEIDWCKGLSDGYKIIVETVDVNGNEGDAEKKVPGLLKSITDAILDVIMKIADAVTALVSMFVDFIWSAIQTMLDVVLEPIWDAYDYWMKNIANALSEIGLDDGPDEKKELSESENAILITAMFSTTFPLVLAILLVVLLIIQDIITTLSFLTGGAASGVGLIIAQAIKAGIGTIKNLFKTIVGGFVIGAIAAAVITLLPEWAPTATSAVLLASGVILTFGECQKVVAKAQM